MQVVVYGRTSSKFPIKTNVPQGIITWPLLWNVNFRDILQHMRNVYTYADEKGSLRPKFVNIHLDPSIPGFE